MADENELAVTPADETKVVETPVDDGIIDLDAPETEVKEDEDGETEQAGDKDAGEEDKPEDKPKKLSGAQRAKFREQRLASENAELQRRLEEATRKPQAQDASEVKPPKEEDFNGDWFAWQRAMTAFEAGNSARDAIRTEFKSKEDSDRQAKQAAIAQERKTAHLERVEDAREVIADFDQVIKEMDGVQVREDVIDEIMSSENSALLAYHLAQNPDKLQALNSMSGRELAREMGRLEATVKMPEAKKATTAPAPLSRPKGGAAPTSHKSDLAAFFKETYGDRAR